MMVRHFAAVLALACSACGIKGPLYLPPKPQATPVAPAAAQPPVEPGPSSPPPASTVPAEKKP
ncbi:MAG: lipoprotein [Burkholderiales bacterium]